MLQINNVLNALSQNALIENKSKRMLSEGMKRKERPHRLGHAYIVAQMFDSISGLSLFRNILRLDGI